MFKILHVPPSHKIVICIIEAKFVTEYISTLKMYVSEIVMEFVLDVREVALNEGCQHNGCNVCDGCQGKYTKVLRKHRTPVFLSVFVSFCL
jgi:hypothetical protein